MSKEPPSASLVEDSQPTLSLHMFGETKSHPIHSGR